MGHEAVVPAVPASDPRKAVGKMPHSRCLRKTNVDAGRACVISLAHVGGLVLGGERLQNSCQSGARRVLAPDQADVPHIG